MLPIRGRCPRWPIPRPRPPALRFSSLPVRHEKPLPPRVKIDESTITEAFLRGTGPGGQKINKTSSAVQLKHLPTGIVVKCQQTRSREQNRRTARRLLGERLEERELGDGARTAVKAERKREKKASAEKKRRRKYRKLEGAKVGEKGGEGGGADESLESGGTRGASGVDQGSAGRGEGEQRDAP